MARRKQGFAEDAMGLAARLPWWVGVILALFVFVLLHLAAGTDVPQPASTRELGGMVIRQFLKTVASILQWLLPVLLLVGAAVSFLKQRRRGWLFRAVADDGIQALSQMSWPEFEALVGEYFCRRDFSVTETGRAGPDGGIDLILTKRGEYYLVQCKRWRAVNVGVETVRELYGVMAARHAVGGFVVTSGSFSVEARKFAEGREIELINGNQLAAAITTQAGRAPISR